MPSPAGIGSMTLLPWPRGQCGARALTESPLGIPAGLALKAISSRTGVLAATLRTWERRYSFTRPASETR